MAQDGEPVVERPPHDRWHTAGSIQVIWPGSRSIRKAVDLLSGPGGLASFLRRQQPAAACEVHHVKHKANGGHTSAKGCVLLCFFHHQVVIHRLGWTLVLNPDGTTTA